MKYTLKEASEKIGMTKSGVLKSIRKGRLSAEKDDKGRWKIDASELQRVYSEEIQLIESSNNKSTIGNSQLPSYINQLEVEIKYLKEQNRTTTERIVELREEKNDWKKQAQTLLLTTERKVKTGIIKRLFSKD